MSYSMQGQVHWVGPTQQITDTFTKRDLILSLPTNNPNYPNYVKLEAHKDKCSILDGIQQGQQVSVTLFIEGRLHTNAQNVTNCYNTLKLWTIQPAQQQAAAPQQAYQAPAPAAPVTPPATPAMPQQAAMPPQTNAQWMDAEHARQQGLQNNIPQVPGTIPPTSPV